MLISSIFTVFIIQTFLTMSKILMTCTMSLQVRDSMPIYLATVDIQDMLRGHTAYIYRLLMRSSCYNVERVWYWLNEPAVSSSTNT